tara:strand:+ start:527 stop:985 length:459 start_codon:yes stop_codon:yes gene_type:complete
MKLLQEIFSSEHSRNLKKAAQVLALSRQFKASWGLIFGRLAGELSFRYLKGGLLYLTASNPIWVSEIKFHEKMILDKIKVSVPKVRVRGLRVQYQEKASPEMTKTETVVPNLSFEEKIKRENQDQKKSGKQRCESCGEIWTKGKICLFCQNQ